MVFRRSRVEGVAEMNGFVETGLKPPIKKAASEETMYISNGVTVSAQATVNEHYNGSDNVTDSSKGLENLLICNEKVNEDNQISNMDESKVDIITESKDDIITESKDDINETNVNEELPEVVESDKVETPCTKESQESSSVVESQESSTVVESQESSTVVVSQETASSVMETQDTNSTIEKEEVVTQKESGTEAGLSSSLH